MESSRAKQSLFEHYKLEGNKIMLIFESLPDIKQKLSEGQDAIINYDIAFHNATSMEEKAASRKNQGFASAKIAFYIDRDEMLSLKILHIFQATRFYREAFYYGTTLDDKWKLGLHSSNQQLWKMLIKILEESDSEEKTVYYQEFLNSVHPDFLIVIYQASHFLSKCYYNIANNEAFKEQYKQAAQSLNFCRTNYMKFMQTKQQMKHQSIPSDFEIPEQHQEEIEFGLQELQTRIQCMIHLQEGNLAIKNSVQQVGINMVLVNRGLDIYSDGLELALSLKDLELQAEFKARLGYVYYKIIKNNEKARAYLFFVVSRIHQEAFNHLKTKEWFLEAKKYLKEIQDIKNDAHVEFRKQYEKEITQIEKEFNNNSPGNFIQYIELHFKPDQWTTSIKEEDLVASKIQRTIARVERYYHPDCRNNLDEALDWVYNQITMYLNQYLTKLRSGDLQV